MSLLAPAQRVLTALVDLGGQAGAGEIAEAAGVSTRTVSTGTAALREAGLIEAAGGAKGRWKLTGAGHAAVLSADPVSAGGALDDALALWADLGLYPHRAFLELLCATVVARHHLHAVNDGPYLGFMAAGDTGTGKSAVADMARELFGLSKARTVRLLPSATPGSVLGRREREDGAYRWVPSPVAAGPLVVFDEFDKAEDAVRRAVLPYFQGQVEVADEDDVLRLLPTPVLTTNVPSRGERLRLLLPEYRRRCVVLDTAYADERGHDLEVALGAWDSRPHPVLRLADVPAPPASLPEDARTLLTSLTHALTKAGRQQKPPTRALEAAALGRAALARDTSIQGLLLATVSVAVAYLTVAEQLPGQVAPGWSLEWGAVREHLAGHGGIDQLEQVVAASRQARAEAQRAVGRARLAGEVDDVDLLGERHALAEELKQAADALERRRVVDLVHRPAAAAHRERLLRWRITVLDCRSRERLEDLRQAVAPVRAEAVGLRQRIDAEIQQRRDERAQAEAAAVQDRAIAAAWNRSQREAAKRSAQERRDHLRQVLKTLREGMRPGEQLWERRTTRPGEQPWRDLEQLGLLTYRADLVEGRGTMRGLLTNLARAVAQEQPGVWTTTIEPRQRFPGGPTSCPQLAQWGEATRAVLWPWLSALHAQEDQAVEALGIKARSSRPRLYRPSVPPPEALALASAQRLELPAARRSLSR